MRNLAGAIALCISFSLQAQQLRVDFDPAKSQIHWTLTGNVHTVHGSFALKQGHLIFDPSTGSISGDLVVDAASGASGNSARDKRMHKDILESDRFQEIRFVPAKVDGKLSLSGPSTVRVSGNFFIHGAAHSITIPLTLSLTDRTVSGTGQFSIPYVDWGMKDPSNFLFKVDKSVEVEVVASGTIAGK